MADMTFKANLLPNSDYEYRLGSITSNPVKRWIVPGTTVETIIGTQTTNTGSWTGVSKTIDALYDGLTIRYFLPYSPSGNATLNLTLKGGTTTGAINCYYAEGRLTTHYGRGSVITLTYFSAGSIKVNGTATTDNRWIADANYADGNDVNVSRITYPRLKTGAVGIGRYSLFMETSDGTYQGLTSTFNSTGTSHIKNTAKFKLGRVYYSNRGSDVAANATVGDNSWVDQQTSLIDLRYSTNCGTTLTSYKPVYLVGTIGTDGYFTLADTWYTQTEPTSEDGKAYIYLGMVYPDTNPYRVAFEIDNPVYWYKNNGFRLYGSGRGISGITRSGTTFTVTRDDGSTFTFTQQDNNSVTGVKGDSESSYRTGNVNITKANIGLGNVDNTADANKTVKYANMLTGFNSYSTSIGWGNQTGTPVIVMNDSTGGSWGFRRDNPAGGQVSQVIDGTIYIKEGQVNVGDAIKSITRSGTTFTYTTLWGNTGTFTQQDNNSDTLVKQTAKTDNVEYKILSTTSASPSSGSAAEAAYGADFTINPSAKTITSPNFKVTSNATITYNTTTGCLEIIV